jgi:hypothetical protein
VVEVPLLPVFAGSGGRARAANIGQDRDTVKLGIFSTSQTFPEHAVGGFLHLFHFSTKSGGLWSAGGGGAAIGVRDGRDDHPIVAFVTS